MHALALDDPRWASLRGGLRVAYDASAALRTLAAGEDPEPIWKELWAALHHQGDVGEASYAALPSLVTIFVERQIIDSNLFSFAATIEVCRTQADNPPIPAWLAPAFLTAWADLFEFGLQVLRKSDDDQVVLSVLPVLALYKGHAQIGRILLELDAREIDEIYKGLPQK
jgi:hypothetical protein